MAARVKLLVLVLLGAPVHGASFSYVSDELTLVLEPLITGGFYLGLKSGNEENRLGHIGRTLSSNYVSEETKNGFELKIGDVTLTVDAVYDDTTNARGMQMRWKGNRSTRFEDCFEFGNMYWYGGPMQEAQIFPIEQSKQQYAAYVTKEDDNGAIMERYWLNSAGQYIYVYEHVPLFVDYNNVVNNSICFGAQIASPYSQMRSIIELSYDFWILPDAKRAHTHAIENYLGKPTGVPDYRMIQHPIWSTWAQYSRDINEMKLLEFANEIRQHGFNDSQLEIDDLWEICYGSLTVDTKKFSNFTKLIQEIKAMGFRITLWVHPFINRDCEPWYSDALKKGYLVLNENGSADTSWWNNNGSIAAYVDFSKPAVAEWWYNRVKIIVDTYAIDSLKFDAGESSWSPQIAVQNGNVFLHPHTIVEAYVRTCARFGDMIEVRTGFRTQDLPVFVRMVDRDSIWGLNNGLSTIITTAFQMNLNGYTLVLPDMIGGNGANLAHEQSTSGPTKELFIRWVQANTFLPAMQYSFVPWNFDVETVEISKHYTNLHAKFADAIHAAMKASVHKGTPVNAPIWWLDPSDEVAQAVWDEYLLGESILVAPVLTEGAWSRDVYLPIGEWLEEGHPDKMHTGPIWLRNFSAPIDKLPYFLLTDSPDSAANSQVTVVIILIGLIVNFLKIL